MGIFDCSFFSGRTGKAKVVLEEVGIEVLKINDVIIQKLRQDVPGQLGMLRIIIDSCLCRRYYHEQGWVVVLRWKVVYQVLFPGYF